MTEKNTNNRIPRPPIVAVMGHIDHGKSTLLDYIRNTNITEKEAGGITQHISAYEAHHTLSDKSERSITFLDTPGHEAFAKMRLRGAHVADVAILVVSAEDGVKTQTLEAVASITESGIPYVVAITKIDKPNADVEKTKNSLLEKEIYLEGLGGTVPFMQVSAKTGKGVSELLELVLLAADLEELSGSSQAPAEGVVIESNIDQKKGISATLIIKDGTLKCGMFVVVGTALSPVRMMENFIGKSVQEISFSSPIRVIGFNSVPEVGSPFRSFTNKKEAENAISKKEGEKTAPVEVEVDITDEQNVIPIIIKVDVLGSLDAIKYEIEKLNSKRTCVRIIQEGVGDISENDVRATGGREDTIIVGFNVSIDSRTTELAERSNIELKTFTVIYDLVKWLGDTMQQRTPKITVEETRGEASVLKVFNSVKDRHVIGATVLSGELSVGERVKIIRRGTEIERGKISNLQRLKEKISTISDGEFGAEVQSKIEIAKGDVIQSFAIVEK